VFGSSGGRRQRGTDLFHQCVIGEVIGRDVVLESSDLAGDRPGCSYRTSEGAH
jgi:hypothetical protein